METRSEKITNLVNNNYFFKEFCYYNTQIANEKHTEIELADLLITFDDSLLVFQLKERDHSAVIDEESEAKWFQKKVLKKAKKQTVRTIEYLEEYKDTQLLNNKGHKIVLDINDYPNVFNIIIFDEDDKLEDRYRNQKGVISSRVGYIHLLSLNAYEIVCKYLHTPVEILEYLIFREELHNEADGVSEEAFLGYYFSGEHDKEPDEEYRTILDDFLDANDEFEMNFLISSFYDKIVDEVKSNDYYEIIRSIALLNRNELLEFRKRFKLAIEKSINEEINLPYRIALPRLDCGFVFIPYPYKESGSTLIALENFTKAHKYDQRLGKCIGVIVRKEIGAPYFEIYWSLIEHEWKYDDLLEDHLLKNFPFRETKAVLKSKY